MSVGDLLLVTVVVAVLLTGYVTLRIDSVLTKDVGTEVGAAGRDEAGAAEVGVDVGTVGNNVVVVCGTEVDDVATDAEVDDSE